MGKKGSKSDPLGREQLSPRGKWRGLGKLSYQHAHAFRGDFNNQSLGQKVQTHSVAQKSLKMGFRLIHCHALVPVLRQSRDQFPERISESGLCCVTSAIFLHVLSPSFLLHHTDTSDPAETVVSVKRTTCLWSLQHLATPGA